MRIKNERIFTADIYEVKNYHERIIGDFGDTCFGNREFEERLSQRDAIVIKFGNFCYIPVVHVKNIFDHLDIASHITKHGGVWMRDERFLVEKSGVGYGDKRFVKNLQPLFKEQGKTSLKRLLEMQRKRPPELTGGMDLF